jgi:uncharacterized lipoprotein NlpE involved in copper resistance/heat shock protein HslJ
MKRNTLFFVVFIALAISCQKQTKKDANTKDSVVLDSVHSIKNVLNFEGLYKGILPCADCEGIETEISINENATYTLKTKYLGKGSKVFEQHGTFSWNKQGNTIVFENIKNAPNQYVVTKNSLIQLDLSGNKIKGTTANSYILTKQKKAIENENAPLEKKATVNLNDRMEAKMMVKSVNPAIGKVTLAETKWQLMVLNGKAVKQTGKQLYFLKLNSKDGKFNAYAGCNTLMGNYAMPSSFGISFSNTIATKMACPKMEVERRFSQMLGEVDSYTLQENILQLKKGKKEVLAIFEPAK